MRKSNWGWVGIAAFLCAPATNAQTYPSEQSNLLFNPELASTLLTPDYSASPDYFDGLYAGIEIGLINNNFNTFYTSGANTYRIPAGVFVGYNHQLQPGLLAGVELQGDINASWTNNAVGYSLMGLGRIGLQTADDFVVYHMAGLGVINDRAAYAVGVGAEQAITQNLSARAQILAYGQSQTPVGVTNYGGFTMMKIDVGAVWHFDDTGVDPLTPIAPSGTRAATDFVGPYMGAYAGVLVNPPYNFLLGNMLNGWHLTNFVQGGIAGWNFELNDYLRAGVEVQGGWGFSTSGTGGWDVETLAHLGVVPIEGLMVYGSAGVGFIQGRSAYSFGGGVEYALWGKNSLRLDAQLLGEIIPGPPEWAPGITATKVTIGSLWHFD